MARTDDTRRLSFKERRCLELVDQGFTVQEIGRIFGAHPLRVERTIARARQRLADIADTDSDDDG